MGEISGQLGSHASHAKKKERKKKRWLMHGAESYLPTYIQVHTYIDGCSPYSTDTCMPIEFFPPSQS